MGAGSRQLLFYDEDDKATWSFDTYSKQHAQGALVITRFRCSLALRDKLMRFAPSDNLLLIKYADSE